MTNLAYIAVGGAAGAILRYAVSGLVFKFIQGPLPWGTIVVNLSGCLAIGILWQLFENFFFTAGMRAFVFIGLLGAYTTFSTYGLETINLLREGEIGYAVFNLLASNVLGIGFIYFGLVLTKSLLNLLK